MDLGKVTIVVDVFGMVGVTLVALLCLIIYVYRK